MISHPAAAHCARAARSAALATAIACVFSFPASAGAATPGIGVERLGESASIGASNLPRYATVILAMHKSSYIPTIKSESPRTRVLGYKSSLAVASGCGSRFATCLSGITYDQALAHDAAHPDDPWLLRDTAGNSIVNPHNTYLHLANVGSRSYRRQWLQQVATAETRLGFDGVSIDDVLAQVSGWSGGAYPTLYPSDSAWETAMKGFVAYVGPRLKSQGLYVLASAYKGDAADGSTTVSWWKAIGGDVSGLLREYWVQAPNNLTHVYDTNPRCW